MKFREGNEAYYLESGKNLENTQIFWGVVAKTPTLIFPPVKDYQQKYYDILIKRIEEGNVSMKYLFSLEYTEQEILQISKQDPQQALGILSQWQKYSHNYPNLDLRYFKMKNSSSFCMGDSRTTVLVTEPKRACLILDESEDSQYQDMFNSFYEKSENNNDEMISRIRAKLSIL